MKRPSELLLESCQISLPLFDSGLPSLSKLGISWDYVNLSGEDRGWLNRYYHFEIGKFLFVSISPVSDLNYAGQRIGTAHVWDSTFHILRDQAKLKRFLAGPGPGARNLAVDYKIEGRHSTLRPRYDLRRHALEIKAEAHSSFEMFVGSREFATESSADEVFKALAPLL